MKLIFTLNEMNIALGAAGSSTLFNSAITHLCSLGVQPVKRKITGGKRHTYSFSVAEAAKALGTTVEALNESLEENKRKRKTN